MLKPAGRVSASKKVTRLLSACVTAALPKRWWLVSTKPLPKGMDYAKAASYQTAYLTAYVALYRRGDLQAGEHLLVHGATGGVGMAAVDLGKYFGAQVIGTGGRDDKLAVVKSAVPIMSLITLRPTARWVVFATR